MHDTQKIIGILALQGSFAEHAVMIRKLGHEPRLVRQLEDTMDIVSIILPGGESTTLMRLLALTGLDHWLKESAEKGLPIYGTCAGMIVLEKLGLMDITTQRNAYGPQLYSFETPVDFIDTEIPGIFIRAPRVERIGDSVEVLGKEEFTPVLVRQNNLLAGSFHPELSSDTRVHEYFLQMLSSHP